MKPGIYLIEVKECEAHAEWIKARRDAASHYPSIASDLIETICPDCNSETGYTETRIEAEAWLAERLVTRGILTEAYAPNFEVKGEPAG